MKLQDLLPFAYFVVLVSALMFSSTPIPFVLCMLATAVVASFLHGRCPRCKKAYALERKGRAVLIEKQPETYNQLWECCACQHSEWRQYKPSSGSGGGGGGGNGGGGGGCGGGGGGC